jgi:hypothetical protein
MANDPGYGIDIGQGPPGIWGPTDPRPTPPIAGPGRPPNWGMGGDPGYSPPWATPGPGKPKPPGTAGQLPSSDPEGSGWVWAFVPGYGWMWAKVPFQGSGGGGGGGDQPHPDQTLPGRGSAGGEHPDISPPQPQPHPDQTLPGELPPDQTA